MSVGNIYRLYISFYNYLIIIKKKKKTKPTHGPHSHHTWGEYHPLEKSQQQNKGPLGHTRQ